MHAFTYGWEDEAGKRVSFWVRFPACTRKPLSWKEELYAAARMVAATAKKPLWLAFSGGIDSEVMCRAFYEQKIPFSVLTIEHSEGTNAYDVRFAKKWCTAHNISQRIVQVDMREFLKTGIEKYIQDEYLTNKAFQHLKILMFEIVESLGGYAVIGSGEQIYCVNPRVTTPSIEDVYLDFPIGYVASLEWCRKNGTDHQPFFHHSTPELSLAYMKIPIVDFAIHHPDIFRSITNRYLFKRMVYQSEFLDMEPRYKSTGFEKILPNALEAKVKLEAAFGSRLEVYRFPVQRMLGQLTGTTLFT